MMKKFLALTITVLLVLSIFLGLLHFPLARADLSYTVSKSGSDTVVSLGGSPVYSSSNANLAFSYVFGQVAGGKVPIWNGLFIGRVDPSYANAELWLKIQPRSFVYFQDNPKQVYFAPVSMSLASNLEFAGTDKNGQTVSNSDLNNLQSLTPDAQGDQFGIWYSAQNQLNENTLLNYQGRNLDPQIFQNEYYTRINLNNFQTLNSEGLWWHDWWFPSVQMNVDVYVYVVGEWVTYQQPSDYPTHLPSPIVHGSWNSFSEALNGVADVLGLSSLFGDYSGWVLLLILIVAGSLLVWYYLKTRNNTTSSSRPHKSSSNRSSYSGGGGGLSSFDWLIIGGVAGLALIFVFLTPGLPDDILLGVFDVGYFWYRTRQKK